MTSLSNLIKREDDFQFDIESFEEEDLGDGIDFPDAGAPNGTLTLPLGEDPFEHPASLNQYDPRRKLERIEREAYETGFAQGQKDGLALGRTKAEETWKKMHALFEELSLLKAKMLEEAEEEIIKLSMTVARKIVKKELTTDPDTVKRSLQHALAFLKDKSFVRVLVNPEDMKILEPYLPALIATKKVERFELAEDHCIDPGGCILETGFGRINATIENQLAELETELEEAFCAGGEAGNGA
jgi:flagellar assembly protein FliH